MKGQANEEADEEDAGLLYCADESCTGADVVDALEPPIWANCAHDTTDEFVRYERRFPLVKAVPVTSTRSGLVGELEMRSYGVGAKDSGAGSTMPGYERAPISRLAGLVFFVLCLVSFLAIVTSPRRVAPRPAIRWDPSVPSANATASARKCRVDAIGGLCEPGPACRQCVKQRFDDVLLACPDQDAAHARGGAEKAVEDAFCRLRR